MPHPCRAVRDRVGTLTLAPSHKMSPSTDPSKLRLTRVARFPNLRALAWSGDILYASRGYQLLRSNIDEKKIEEKKIGEEKTADDFRLANWQSVATFNPGWKRKLSSANALTARLLPRRLSRPRGLALRGTRGRGARSDPLTPSG